MKLNPTALELIALRRGDFEVLRLFEHALPDFLDDRNALNRWKFEDVVDRYATHNVNVTPSRHDRLLRRLLIPAIRSQNLVDRCEGDLQLLVRRVEVQEEADAGDGRRSRIILPATFEAHHFSR